MLKALRLAREAGARTALDIDYRPNLWGLSGHDDGENRFIASEKVTAKLQSTLHWFDLIVGTEEEFHIAGGSTDTLTALRAVREKTAAILVCKRGAKGASAFVGAIPDDLDDGVTGPGFPIEVFNVLGAGDGFMSGLLAGWMRDEDWPTALKYANACGAFAVSRHGCTPAYPSWTELEYFLEHGSTEKALRKDKALDQIHWSTNRREDWPEMHVFAFDHRKQLEDMADELGVSHDLIGPFKQLCLEATERVADGRPGYGLLCDGRLGRDALYKAADTGLWIGRPVEDPGTRPLKLEIGPDLGTDLLEWPPNHVVKVLCFYHPDDSDEMKQQQEEMVIRLADAARSNRLELLLEVIPSKVGPITDDTAAMIIERFYQLGVYPDWWKLEPMKSETAWSRACAMVTKYDPYCRGIVVLGLEAPTDQLAESFRTAAKFDLVKGFAVGRTIFAEVARRWFAQAISDADAIAEMSGTFQNLCTLWDEARTLAR